MSAQPPRLDETGPPVAWDVLARYLAGECDAGEADTVRRWLDAHPADAQLLHALDAALDRLAIRPVVEIDVERALGHVAARRDVDAAPNPVLNAAPNGVIDGVTNGVRPIRREPVSTRWRTPMLRAAAIVVAAVGGALAWQTVRRGTPAETAEQRYATGVGQRDSVRLPDGSRVVLGPDSRLVVGARYGRPAREVELRGEAWFDVRHDTAHAFTVRAGAATIRDLGTTFTVRTGDDARVRVAVSSGTVLLDAVGHADGPGVVLRQGDVGELQPDGHALARPGGASDDDEAWTRGRLVFRETPLDEVRTTLRRWYGIELQVTDSLIAARHLTATFDGEPVGRVLEVIALALGASVDRRGDTVTVGRR